MNTIKENLQVIRSAIKNIASIDKGVKKYLFRLNDLGYLTYSSCSGLISEHGKLKNRVDNFEENLQASVSIYVKYRETKETFFKLKQILHGTGWNIGYSIAYRCYRNGKEMAYQDNRDIYLRRFSGKYVPIHICYSTKTNDINKIKAWERLLYLLEREK